MRLCALCVAFVFVSCATTEPRQNAEPVTVKLIAFNDFHGQLSPPGTPTRVPDPTSQGSLELPTGGAAWLAGLVAQLKAQNRLNVVVAAGDLISGSPLNSALFHDEPSIEALNALGLEFSSVGNHEFDHGAAELKRMQTGGCAPSNAKQSCHGHQFAGARFKYLAANVLDTSIGQTIFPASAVKTLDLGGGKGALRIGFIGAVVKTVPDLVVRGAVTTLSFSDEANAINAAVPALRAQGVDAIVVLIHEGGRTSANAFDDDTCPNFQGDILPILDRLDPSIDVIVSGHTHRAYICRRNGKLVTSAGSQGRYVTDIELKNDPRAHRVLATNARQLAAVNDLAPNPDAVRHPTMAANAQVLAIVDAYTAAAAPLTERVVAHVYGNILNEVSESGESALGDFIADAQLAATASPDAGGAQIAIMNASGIRAPLISRNGDVTYGALHTIHPFGNSLITMSLSGADLHEVLERQWNGGTRLVFSEGFSYTWHSAAAPGAKVDPADIRLNGRTIDPAATYRVAMNEFLGDGGDGFALFRDGKDRVRGMLDIEALERYLVMKAPVTAPRTGRVQKK
jgi:5'-nucleotidase